MDPKFDPEQDAANIVEHGLSQLLRRGEKINEG